jgi:DNA-directed RNA polymerase subunit beta'
MAHLDPTEAFETLKQRVTKTIADSFPVSGDKHTLTAKRVWVDDAKHIDDIRTQKEAKLKGRDWSVPVRAELELRDAKTGKIVDRQTINVAQLPKITRRYSYIVGGNEWQVNNQFRLKSGVYTHVKANGELASQWNLAKGLGFEMNLDPKSRQMTVQYKGKGANIPLYPLLKTMGVDDDAIERKWGKEILTANKKVKSEAALRKFFKTHTGKNPETLQEAEQYIRDTFDATELRGDSTKITLGKAFDKVDGAALLAGSHRILKVARQEEPQDDRDSLEFKDLFSAEDLLSHRLEKKHLRDIQRKLGNPLNKKDKNKIRQVIHPDIFNKPIRSFFTSSSLAERPDQMNPMSFISGNRRTTILGEGGISSEHQITPGAKSINPSHMGFLDPIQTPESGRIGSTLQLALGATKAGHELKVRAVNPRTNKEVWLTPGQALSSNLAFPDQYTVKGGKRTPVAKDVRVASTDGSITTVKPGDVDYVLKSSRGMFDLNSNLIPFVQNNQGNRTMVASRQAEQAISLTEREAPLVQVKSDTKRTFENIIGDFISHPTPVSGTVEKVSKDAIYVKDKDGKRHEVQIYNDFPLNDDRSLFNSTPLVKAGDQVKKGQTIADSNFTRDGTLALGKNLNVAYMPYRGYNFEDGIVVSETAAKKLTSDHMHRANVTSEKNIVLNKKKFLAETAGTTTKDQAAKLDDDGVIMEGQTVAAGDILIGTMRKEEVRPEQRMLGLFSKKLIRPVRPIEQRWDKDEPGVVTKVVKHGKKTTVYVKSQSSLTIGDKVVGRHGNKGIVTKILPDHEMPHDKDGNPTEMLLNPTGVPTRINLGQVLETAAAKIAQKKGSPYVVKNFDPSNPDYTRNLRKELKSLGVSDTETLFDPDTKREFAKVLTGPQYIYKLHHTAAKGLTARSRDAYDSNMTPQGGGDKGGQTMDAAGLYALLAHNARENVREMQTYKSDMNDEFWAMIQAGDSIPTPKIPFTYKKFEGYLKAMGVDPKKVGNDIILQPLTDKKTLDMSNGELKDPGRAFKGKNLQPETGGIFDPAVTGNNWPVGKLGDKWSHIKLSDRMPNPVFEKPIQALLDINRNQFSSVVKGNGDIGGKTGPAAIVSALKDINVEAKEAELQKQIKGLRGTKLNKVNKQLKYLRALKTAGLSPKEAYTMRNLPVLPPNMRPVSIMDSGDLNLDDLNRIYQKIGAVNDQLKSFPKGLPPEERVPIQNDMYDGLKALTFEGTISQGRHLNSIAHMLAGRSSPKEGFFQKRVIGKRQDLSMRGTIVPEPSLSLDEVAVPRKAAAELYKPFTVAQLVRQGWTPLDAQQQVKQNTPAARAALEQAVSERPLMLKRDPVLHKFGVQAFKPRLVEGKAVKIHPLATSGYNADFDGDKMSAYVPVSPKAIQETYKMMPSSNLFNPSTGRLMFAPSHESMMGLFKLTEVGRDKGKRFKGIAAAARAVKDGELDVNELISLDDLSASGELKKLSAKPTKTTVGRLMIYNALPESLKDERILTDKKFLLDKGNLHDLLSKAAKTKDFANVADKLKDIGNTWSTGLSIGLEDFESDSEYRDKVLAIANKQETKIKSKGLSKAKRDEQLVELYNRYASLLHDQGEVRAKKKPNRMYDWVKSKARGNWDQFKQMTVAPMLVTDSQGKTVPVPITKSYSEGLDIGSYWASMHGARMGTISRVEGTWRPGLIGKQITQTTMNQMITGQDCKTNKGVPIRVDDREVLDRYLARDVKLGVKGGKDKGNIPAGTLLSPDVINRLRNNKVDEVSVRSPLKCSHGEGLCATCYGLNEKGQLYSNGTNVGIIAAQALGEPASQLSMNAFHTGGVVGAKGTTASGVFTRLEQLVNLPATLPGSAVLSNVTGKVTKVVKDPATGGHDVYIDKQRHFAGSRRKVAVKRGQTVSKGEALTAGPKNPHDMLPLSGLPSVQRYLTDEIHNVYKNEGPVKRRNVEVFVRSMTNLGEVLDPGDHPVLLRGDRTPVAEVSTYNSKLGAGAKPVIHRPMLKGVSLLPLEMQTDWLAKMQSSRLKQTVIDAAAEGWKTELHSTHPIPGMAYGKDFGKGTPEKPYLY